jgi:hypothetical protein
VYGYAIATSVATLQGSVSVSSDSEGATIELGVGRSWVSCSTVSDEVGGDFWLDILGDTGSTGGGVSLPLPPHAAHIDTTEAIDRIRTTML